MEAHHIRFILSIQFARRNATKYRDREVDRSLFTEIQRQYYGCFFRTIGRRKTYACLLAVYASGLTNSSHCFTLRYA